MRTLRVALAQINSTVGDLEGNTAKIIGYVRRARDAGADLVAFPELAVTGYPPEDLLLKPSFLKANTAALHRIVDASRGITVVTGFVDVDDDIFNAAAVIHDGELIYAYHKVYLPNYGVFDEERYFQRGSEQPVFLMSGVKLGVSVCEDVWYSPGPVSIQAQAGAQVQVNINASPYHRGKREFRERMLATRAADNEMIVCYVNMVGGQDELVFDGASLVYDQGGRLVARGKQFEEQLLVVDLDVEAVFRSRLHDPRRRKEPIFPVLAEVATPEIALEGDPVASPRPSLESDYDPAVLEGPAEVYAALVTGTRDYVLKNRFKKVLIGLSGGIDSTLVAAVAADALGPENVIGVSMPSRYSSEGSKDDARDLAQALGIEYLTIPIERPF
ncbi:MAG TPA: nitrilase-related carbon-nitrogen hydrolase, partial [Chloroflexota bacterium]